MSELFKAQRTFIGTGGASAAGGIRDFTSKAIQANTSPNEFSAAFEGLRELVAELKKNNDAELLAQEFNNFSTDLTKDVTTFEPGGDPETLRQRYLTKIEAATESMPANVAAAFRSRAMNDLRTQWGGLLASEFEASQKRIFREQKQATEILGNDVINAYSDLIDAESRSDTIFDSNDLSAAQNDIEQKIADFRDFAESIERSGSAYNHPLFADQQIAKLTSGIALVRGNEELRGMSKEQRKEFIANIKANNFKGMPEEIQALASLRPEERTKFVERLAAFEIAHSSWEAAFQTNELNKFKQAFAEQIDARNEARDAGDLNKAVAITESLRRDIKTFLNNFGGDVDVSGMMKDVLAIDVNKERAAKELAREQYMVAQEVYLNQHNAAILRKIPGAVEVSQFDLERQEITVVMQDGTAKTMKFPDNFQNEIDQERASREISESNISFQEKLKQLNALNKTMYGAATTGARLTAVEAATNVAPILQKSITATLADTNENNPARGTVHWDNAVKYHHLALETDDPVQTVRYLDRAESELRKSFSQTEAQWKTYQAAKAVETNRTRNPADLKKWEQHHNLNPTKLMATAARLSAGLKITEEQRTDIKKLRNMIARGLVPSSVADFMSHALSTVDASIEDKEAAGQMLRGFHSVVKHLIDDNLEKNLRDGLDDKTENRWIILDTLMRMEDLPNTNVVELYSKAFDPNNQVGDEPDEWANDFRSAFEGLADPAFFLGTDFVDLPETLKETALTIGRRIRTTFPEFGNNPEMIAKKAWRLMQKEQKLAMSASSLPLTGLGDNPATRLSKNSIEFHWPHAASVMHGIIEKEIKENANFAFGQQFFDPVKQRTMALTELIPLNNKTAELGQTVFLEATGTTVVDGKVMPRFYAVKSANQAGRFENVMVSTGVDDDEFTPMLIDAHAIYKSIDEKSRKLWKQSHEAGINQAISLAKWRRGEERGNLQPLTFPTLDNAGSPGTTQ